MNEVLMWKLVDAAFKLADVYLTREDVVAMVKQKEDSGATPEQIVQFLHDARVEAAAAARKAVADKLAVS